MRYRQIEAFQHVMITGTTTDAANMMSISQPAVSRLIADLEISLKFKLFKRHRGRLYPTLKAISFYRGVDEFFIGFDRLEQIAEQIRTQQPADLKLCATPALATFVFPEAIRNFREIAPNVNLLIESGSSTEIINKLHSQLIHLGLCLAFPEAPGIIQESLAELPHICAMHESHPLAEKSIIDPQDLSGEQVLSILPSGLVNWNQISQLLSEQNVDYKTNVGIQNSHIGYSIVAANLAVAIIEPFAAGPWENNGVVTRPFEPSISYKYVMAYSSNQNVPDDVLGFSRIVKDIFTKRFPGRASCASLGMQ